jgi:hypothetical protein
MERRTERRFPSVMLGPNFLTGSIIVKLTRSSRSVLPAIRNLDIIHEYAMFQLEITRQGDRPLHSLSQNNNI